MLCPSQCPAPPSTLLTYGSEPGHPTTGALGEGGKLAGIVALILHGQPPEDQRGIPHLWASLVPGALSHGEEGQPLLAKLWAGEAETV